MRAFIHLAPGVHVYTLKFYFHFPLSCGWLDMTWHWPQQTLEATKERNLMLYYPKLGCYTWNHFFSKRRYDRAQPKIAWSLFLLILQVSVSVIPYLETKDWEHLGVGAIGDRVVLVQLSKAQLSKWQQCYLFSYHFYSSFPPSKEMQLWHLKWALSAPATPSTSKAFGDGSLATKAERLCGKILSGTLTNNQTTRRREFVL